MDEWRLLDCAVALAVGVCLGLVVAMYAARKQPGTGDEAKE